MILTPFGSLEYDDEDALRQWQAAHDQQHRTERLALLQAGVPVTGFSLTGKSGPGWFGVHMLMHLAYERYFTPTGSDTAQQLAHRWKDKQSFYRWHQIHNALHEQFGNSLGIAATMPTGFQTPRTASPFVTNYALLLESGSYLLQESGSKILL